MKKMNTTILVVLTAAILLIMSACGNNAKTEETAPAASTAPTADATAAPAETAKPAEHVDLHFAMAGFQNEIPGWTAVIAEANKQLADKNITVIIDNIPVQGWDQYYQKMITLLAAGKAPDI